MSELPRRIRIKKSLAKVKSESNFCQVFCFYTILFLCGFI